MEAAQPPVVSPANAAQVLRSSVSTEALLASGNAAPSWTQRLRFDLTPMLAAVSPAHQNAVRAPAPYYPAPDTSWTKEASAAEDLPPYDNDTPQVAAEPQTAAEAAPSVPAPAPAPAPTETMITSSTETLVAPPVAQPAPVTPAAPVVAAVPVEATPVETASVPEPLPVETAPVAVASVDTAAVDTAPVETAPVEATSVETALADVPAEIDDPTSAPLETVAAEPAEPVETAAVPPAPATVPAVDETAASPSLVATLNWVYGDTTATLPSEDDTATNTAPELTFQTAAAQPTTPSTAGTAFDTNVALSGEKRVIEVRRGDTLFGLLTKAGLSDTEAQAASHSLADVFSPSDLKIGQEITLSFATGAGPQVESDSKLVALTLQPSMERDVKLTRDSEGQFVAAAINKPLTERVDRAAGQIDISLFEAARESGVPVALIGDIIKAFSYDVDFQRDIHEGDSFEVMYERFDNEKGDLAKAGKLLYASLIVGGKPMAIYYFERDGDGEYFTADGVAVRKSLLKTPIDGAKITSGYGMRVNPILGYSAMHQGIDFGAPKGTPIFAAGNGTIEEMEWKNGYGNFVKLRHNGTYETAYAHTSRFASGLHKGSKVKQGQVIAYVGSTGNSTGPHLHFEIIVNGQHVNPSTVKTVASDKLGGSDLKAFKAQVASIQKQRRDLINRAEIADQSGAPVLDCNRQRGCLN